MSLSRLASVEVQLIMQFLPSGDILQLARSNRLTLHSAAALHVWRFAEPVCVPEGIAPPSSPSLLRHVPLLFEWSPPRSVPGSDALSCSRAFLARLAAVSPDRVYGVDAWRSKRWIPVHDWIRVLSDERLSAVRFIALDPPIPVRDGLCARLVDVMSQLPALHTLRICDVGMESDGSSPLALLPSFPSLTALDIASYSSAIDPVQFEPVARCTQLRSLAWTVEDATWAALTASPSFRRLEQLKFRWISCDHWNERFQSIQSMACLRELHFYFLRFTPALADSMEGLAPLLPPSFRLIVLRPDLSPGQRVSIDSMVRILRCTPEHVQLQLLLKPSGLSADEDPCLDLDEARRAFAEFNDALLLEPFKGSGRLSVRMCVAPAPPPVARSFAKPPRCEPRRK